MKCFTPERLKSGAYVPCGKCAPCINKKRTDWAIRVFHEAMEAQCLFFCTMTYSDEYLTYVDDVPVLQYNDVQKFFKKVRKMGFKFRYFMVGEYGEKNSRPHYHIILFFENQVDINIILNKWNLGFHHVGQVTMASLMYMLKDMLKEVDLFEEVERQFKPEIRCSKGIGKVYAEKMLKWHLSNPRDNSFTILNGFKNAIPRYIKQKLLELARKDEIIKKLNLNANMDYRTNTDSRRKGSGILYSSSNKQSVKKEQEKERIKHKGFEQARKNQLRINHFNKKL